MELFGKKPVDVPPHPRQEPHIKEPLTPQNVEKCFENCADFAKKTVMVAGDEAQLLTLYYIQGMVRMERVSEYVLRPLAQDGRLTAVDDLEVLFYQMQKGALYNLTTEVRTTMDQVAYDLVVGFCVLMAPGLDKALSFFVGTEEKRAIGDPENEPDLKGSREAFAETLRTNTSMVRRRVRTTDLKIKEQFVGRKTVTPVGVLWIEGLTNPDMVAQVEARLEKIDVDGLLTTGYLEQYITDDIQTTVPLISYTQRPDRFCGGLLEGRVGVLVDGLPLGYLMPCTVSQCVRAGQDQSNNWILAGAISFLRYLCMAVTLLLPGLYTAAVMFHWEMIPTGLALSIIAAKQDVPFGTVFEVLVMLLAFEILQEAGLRLPSTIGQTVSILGGLVVGTAAVEAKIVSPAVLIVVAVAGICGYTMPSQDLAGALRLWRFALAVLAGIWGIFGLTVGIIAIVYHLASLESLGVAWLTPFAAEDSTKTMISAILRRPLPKVKLRERALDTEDRRKQG